MGQRKAKLISLSEAAELLGQHPETLRRAVRTGRLRPARRGAHGEYLFSRWSVAAFRARRPGRPVLGGKTAAEFWAPLLGVLPRLDLAAQQYVDRTLAYRRHDPDLRRLLTFRRLLASGESQRRAATRFRPAITMRQADQWAKADASALRRVIEARMRDRLSPA